MSDWWQGAVFYQIYPRSFKDSNNDGIGDLLGIAEKMPYVASLGVDAIWLSPFFKSPMKDFGYDVADYCDVDKIFGDLDDFDVMLKAAHDNGLKIIIDLVLSHTSDQHDWFKESKKNRINDKADWYVWADPKPDGSPPNNWLGVFGGVGWEYDIGRGQYYFHSFLREQPDLNVRNPIVQDALLEQAKFWLDRGVDGFRLDAVNHCIHDAEFRDNPVREINIDDFQNAQYKTPCPYDMQYHKFDKSQPENLDFMERMRALTNKYDNRMMVAEIGGDDCVKQSAEYTATGKRIHTAYNFSLLGWESGAEAFKDAIEEFDAAGDEYSWPSWALSNHDIIRVASRGTPKNKELSHTRSKMLIALLTCLRGTIYLYQGEELGLTEVDIPFDKLQDPFGIFLYPDSKGRDGCRTPMPWTNEEHGAGFSKAVETWLPIPKEHKDMSVLMQENDGDSTLNFTRNFLRWRREYPSLITGKIDFKIAKGNTLLFTRSLGSETIVAGFNLGEEIVKIPKENNWQILDGYGLQCNISDNDDLELPAFGGFFAHVS